jgi:hypothetical protein
MTMGVGVRECVAGLKHGVLVIEASDLDIF